jgi:hypothetical protein
MMVANPRFVTLLLSFVLSATLFSSGQTANTTVRKLTGIVADQSGAVIVGATAVLKDQHGTTCGLAKTNSSGRFTVPSCASAATLTVVHPGFQDFQRQFPTAPTQDIQVTLQVAVANVGINVEASAVEVSTETAQNTNTTQIDAEAMKQLPVLDQDYIAMMSNFLDAGALGTGGVSLIVNGVEANGPGVSASAVQSVKINNNPYSAMFSRPGRARLEIITKGGTPKIHGEINGSYRNSIFAATPAYATSKPDEQRRYFEGSFTGPLGTNPKNTFLASANYDDLGSQAVVNAVTLAGPVHDTVPTPQKHFFGSFRGFHDYGQGNQLWIGYSYEYADRKNQGIGGTTLRDAGYEATDKEHEINFSHTYLINQKWVNQLRGLVGHNAQPKLVSNEISPQIIVPGAFISGGAQADSKRTEMHFDGNDTLTYSSGKHEVKFGVDVPDISRRGADDWTNQRGTYIFSSLAAFAAGTPQTLTVQQGNGHLVFLEATFALFAEDTVRFRPNFSVTYGARYYFQKYFHNDTNNVAPRLGFAWAPGSQRKLVIRGGSGIFFDRSGPRPIADLLHFNGIDLRRYVIGAPTYPVMPSTVGLPISLVTLAPNVVIPYTIQYSAGFEQQIGKKSVLSAEWIGTRGIHLFRSIDTNAPSPPLYLTRPNAALGQVRTIESDGRSLGNAMEVSMRSAASKYVTVQTQYRLAKTYGNTEGITFFPANSYFPGLDYARTSSDERHRFTVLGTAKLPAGFVAGTSVTLHSGTPYTETTGADNNLDGILTDRPVGVPRNSLHGPRHIHADVKLGRDFRITHPAAAADKSKPSDNEGMVISTSVSAYNILNHRNDSQFVGVITSPFFGQATSAESPRRVQFNATLTF